LRADISFPPALFVVPSLGLCLEAATPFAPPTGVLTSP